MVAFSLLLLVFFFFFPENRYNLRVSTYIVRKDSECFHNYFRKSTFILSTVRQLHLLCKYNRTYAQTTRPSFVVLWYTSCDIIEHDKSRFLSELYNTDILTKSTMSPCINLVKCDVHSCSWERFRNARCYLANQFLFDRRRRDARLTVRNGANINAESN